jgi:hypothetical protein
MVVAVDNGFRLVKPSSNLALIERANGKRQIMIWDGRRQVSSENAQFNAQTECSTRSDHSLRQSRCLD